MTTDLTPERLDEIEVHATSALPGDWPSVDAKRLAGSSGRLIRSLDPDTVLALVRMARRCAELENAIRDDDEEKQCADALRAENTALRAEIEELREVSG